jgi:hypothetical protein
MILFTPDSHKGLQRGFGRFCRRDACTGLLRVSDPGTTRAATNMKRDYYAGQEGLCRNLHSAFVEIVHLCVQEPNKADEGTMTTVRMHTSLALLKEDHLN